MFLHVLSAVDGKFAFNFIAGDAVAFGTFLIENWQNLGAEIDCMSRNTSKGTQAEDKESLLVVHEGFEIIEIERRAMERLVGYWPTRESCGSLLDPWRNRTWRGKHFR